MGTPEIDVWILSRHDGKNMDALAFPTLDKLIEYVTDYYSIDDESITAPSDGDDLGEWLDNIAEGFGIALAMDHDLMEV